MFAVGEVLLPICPFYYSMELVCIVILMLQFHFSRQSYGISYAIAWKKNRRKELKMISVRIILKYESACFAHER